MFLWLQEKNPGQGSLCCIICWLKHTTHTLPLFPCRVLLYNIMHLMQMGTQKGGWLLTLSQEEGTLYLPAESQFMQSHVMAAELYSPDCFMGSCILNTLMVECWLTLNQHPDLYLVDTRSTLDQQSVTNWPTVNWLISMNRKLVDFRSTVDQGDNGVSIECQVRYR